MKSMKRARSEAPDLNDCIRSLENLTKDLLSTRSPKTVGEIYVSALGLLYHLKLDQKKILRCDYLTHINKILSSALVPHIIFVQN